MRATYESLAAAVQLAAFDPQAWLNATAEMAAFCGGRVGNIIAADGQGRIVLNPISGVSRDFLDELGDRSGQTEHNPRVRAALSRPLMTPYTDDEILSKGQRERHEIYDVFDRGDTGFASSVLLYRQPGFLAGVAVGSPHQGRDGCPHHHERLNQCAVLIRDAIRFRIILEDRSLESLTNGLEAMQLGAFLCRDDGFVLRATAEGEALLWPGDRLKLRDGRLTAAAARQDADLQTALVQALRDSGRACRTLIVTDKEGERPMTLDIARLPTDPFTLGFSPKLMVVARARPERTVTGAEALRRTYGLTAAETEVAASLAAGEAPEDIARQRQVSLDTVRAQVRSIYSKTGVTRATKLVRLLEGLS